MPISRCGMLLHIRCCQKTLGNFFKRFMLWPYVQSNYVPTLFHIELIVANVQQTMKLCLS
jgi:hypothetical protein